MAATFDSETVKCEFNQYWYSQRTIDSLLAEATHHATRCAFLSTPSLYFALGATSAPADDASDDAKAEHQRAVTLRRNSKLFEFDRQWQADPGFVFYDFQKPEQIPIQYMNAFDYVVVDPPFITKEVWAKYVETIKLIVKRPDVREGEASNAVGAGEVRDCLGGGKVLFTTVLENHTMLEGLINGPLFIPRFRPYVRNLVYQYVCFLNYDATRLQVANPEVPEDDAESRKLWAAIGMANDIRHSETAFALQMEQRDRDGEAPLPRLAHEQDMQMGIVDANGGVVEHRSDGAPAAASEKDMSNAPISEMRWGYIPDGLTMYPDGNTPPPSLADAHHGGQPGAPEEEDPAQYGPLYIATLGLRTELDDFKGRIDQMQKILDAQMKLRHQRVRLNKEKQQLQQEADNEEKAAALAAVEAALAEATSKIETSEAERVAHLDGMSALATAILADEQSLAKLKARQGGDTNLDEAGDTVNVPYEVAMADCISRYREVEVKKVPLQELAADATRKFKSPIFFRMKELLQEMKDIKKAHRAQ